MFFFLKQKRILSRNDVAQRKMSSSNTPSASFPGAYFAGQVYMFYFAQRIPASVR